LFANLPYNLPKVPDKLLYARKTFGRLWYKLPG
jgi:hypothetical protein